MKKIDLTIEELVPQEDKIRILTTSDDPRLTTGFGVVHRHILKKLYENPKFQIVTAGWTPPRDPNTESAPFRDDGFTAPNKTGWNIIDCLPFMVDNHGKQTVPKIVKRFQPHVILTIGDPWMIEPVAKIKRDFPNAFTWIAYVPIDGFPLRKSFADVLKNVDGLVAYSSWAKNIMREALPEKEIFVVNHGTDTDVFYPLNEDKKALRENIGLKDTEFLIGWVARNTARKRVDIAIKAFAYFSSASITCPHCQVEYFEVDETGKNGYFFELSKIKKGEKIICEKCDNEMILSERKKDTRLYLHTPGNEKEGFDIDAIANEFGVNGMILYPDSVRVGQGVTEDYMNILMNSFDATFNSAEAEGWGLPISESMACKVPVVVPNFGGYLGDLVRPFDTALVAENDAINRDLMTNYMRALPSGRHIGMLLDYIYHSKNGSLEAFAKRWNIESKYPSFYSLISNENLLDEIIERAYEQASSMKWSDLANKFNDIINICTPELQKKDLLEHIENGVAQSNKGKTILAISDTAQPSDMFFGGAEKSFFENLQLLTDEYEVFSSGYANQRQPVFNFGLKEYKDIKILNANYRLGGSKDFVKSIKPDFIFGFGISLPECYELSIANSIPLVSFVNHWDLLCGNPLRMGTCNLNCQSCSSFLDKSHLGIHKSVMQALDHSSLIVFPSKYAKNLFCNNWGKRLKNVESKCIVVYPYVDKYDDAIVSQSWDNNKEKKYITLMSSREEKGSLVFGEVAFNMPQYDFLGVDVVGDVTNNFFENIPAMITTPKLARPSEVYSSSKLVLVPSIWREPFSRVAFEAALNGVPVLAADHAGMSEVLPQTALVGNYFRADSWIPKVERVMGDMKFRNKLIADLHTHYKLYIKKQQSQQEEFKTRLEDLNCSLTL